MPVLALAPDEGLGMVGPEERHLLREVLSFVFEGAELLSYADIISEIRFEDTETLFKTAFDDELFTLSAVYPLDENTK